MALLFASAAHAAAVTFAEHPELMTDWDARRTNKRLEPLQDYVPEVLRQSRCTGRSCRLALELQAHCRVHPHTQWVAFTISLHEELAILIRQLHLLETL